MTTAFAYCRVSTSEQAADGVSLSAQRAKAEAWAALNDYDLAGIFTDAGLSGSRADNRPALQDALDAVCRSKGVLVVYSLSRLARSTRDTLAIAARLDRAGADLVSLSERLDTTSAVGRMIFRLLATLAEFERDQISERTKMALAHKISNGERCGKIRYGYTLGTDGKTLVPIVEEQKVIGLILRLRSRGRSFRKIAEELTRRGHPTKEGNERWTHQAVARIASRAA